MSFWTPVENPGTRPPRSRVFDIGGALGSFGSYSFPQAARTDPGRGCDPGRVGYRPRGARRGPAACLASCGPSEVP